MEMLSFQKTKRQMTRTTRVTNHFLMENTYTSFSILYKLGERNNENTICLALREKRETESESEREARWESINRTVVDDASHGR